MKALLKAIALEAEYQIMAERVEQNAGVRLTRKGFYDALRFEQRHFPKVN